MFQILLRILCCAGDVYFNSLFAYISMIVFVGIIRLGL